MRAHLQTPSTRTRPVPSRLAPILQELELRQPTVVTRAFLAEIAAAAGLDLDPASVAERLVRLGWLLPLRKRDAWEFAPAARAGRYRSGDPWIELRAVLQHEPSAPVAIAFESAVWEWGHSPHQPTVPVIAHRRGWRPPRALNARAVTLEWVLPVEVIRGLPVLSRATTLVAAACRPAAQGNWTNADEWLPEIFRATTPKDVLTEAAGRPPSTLARLGYLAEWSGRDDIAELIAALLPPQPAVSFLGDRTLSKRWSSRWRVYDALLPNR